MTRDPSIFGRIRLDEQNFRDLVSGKQIVVECVSGRSGVVRIEMILADIGWPVMIEAIHSAASQHLKPDGGPESS